MTGIAKSDERKSGPGDAVMLQNQILIHSKATTDYNLNPLFCSLVADRRHYSGRLSRQLQSLTSHLALGLALAMLPDVVLQQLGI
jgi:hypothetical protein